MEEITSALWGEFTSLCGGGLLKALNDKSRQDLVLDAIKNATKRACENYDDQKVAYEKNSPKKIMKGLRNIADVLDERRLTNCLDDAFSVELPPVYVSRWFTQFCKELETNEALHTYFNIDFKCQIIQICSELREQKNEAESIEADRVQEVIKQYAENFAKPLFLHEDNDKVNLTNLYIPPRIMYQLYEGRGFEPLLCSFLQNSSRKMLFVEGDAAVGKTALVSHLCYQYLHGDKSIFQDRPLVCVRLRDLDVSVPHTRDTKYLLSYLGIASEKDFSQRYGNAIIVLDGADELVMIEGKQLRMDVTEFFLNLQDAFRNCKWVITGRPQYVNKLKIRQEISLAEATILHFNSEMRQEWADAYCQKCEETLSPETERFIRTMTGEDASGVADTPLALYLLAQSKAGESYKDNPWLLYHEIFSSALFETKYNRNIASNRQTRKHWTKDYSEGIYHFIGQIAFQMFQNDNDEFITSDQLAHLVKQEETSKEILTLVAENDEKEWVRSLCSICAYWKDNGRGALEFYHNNIRDFFFCEYIYDRIKDCLNLENSKEPIDSERFVITAAELFPYRPIASSPEENSTWSQTFIFLYYRLLYEYTELKGEPTLCSLTIKETDNPIIDTLYKLLKSPTLLSALGRSQCQLLPVFQIKNTYLNSLFLSRIWQQIYREKCEIFFVRMWKTNEQRIDWEKIFFTWPDLFRYYIQDKRKQFSIGK